MVMGFLTKADSIKRTNCLSCDYHVNSTWIGNKRCIPARDTQCNVLVKCRLETTTDLGELISYPEIVHSLDLSRSGLTTLEEDVFFKYKKLISLNLSHNSINNISSNAFNGLRNVQILDLSFNKLASWNTVDIKMQMLSLKELYVGSNPSWYPVLQHLADLPNITCINGIYSYSFPTVQYDKCISCNLCKSFNRKQQNIDLFSITYRCFKVTFTSKRSSNFSINCHLVKKGTYDSCQKSHFVKTFSRYSVEIIDKCFQNVNKWTYLNIPIGMVAMATNLAVMATISFSVNLRKNVNMFLIANMAIGDFLQGLWLVVLTTTRTFMTSTQFHVLKHSWPCYFLIILFTVAQGLSVQVGFLVTVERYLCIVYSMNPAIRVTKRIAKILMVCVFLATAISVCFLFALNMKSGKGYSCLDFYAPGFKLYTYYIGTIGTLFYIICYFLYARIFYVVRQSSLNMGIQREGKLAKAILLVLSTNVFFFLCPLIAGQFLIRFQLFSYSERLIFWDVFSHSFLGINSWLNPILYAFRNERFRNELKQRLRCKQNSTGAAANNVQYKAR